MLNYTILSHWFRCKNVHETFFSNSVQKPLKKVVKRKQQKKTVAVRDNKKLGAGMVGVLCITLRLE